VPGATPSRYGWTRSSSLPTDFLTFKHGLRWARCVH
jgi:hypothetical protein